MDIDVTKEDSPGGGRYVARAGGDGPEGELIFSRPRPGVVSADHTLVPAALEGKGVGSALVKALVADARARGERIVPACSFVQAQQRRHPEWADLFTA